MKKFLKWKGAPAVTMIIGMTGIISPYWTFALAFLFIALVVVIGNSE